MKNFACICTTSLNTEASGSEFISYRDNEHSGNTRPSGPNWQCIECTITTSTPQYVVLKKVPIKSWVAAKQEAKRQS
jgi:hypothetical protein